MISGQPVGIDVACIGETMGQFVPNDGLGIQRALSFALHQAGSESNVAIGLARLDHRVSWVSRLGDDAVGKRILMSIREHGVETTAVQIMHSAQTGIFLKDPGPGASMVSYYRRGSAASGLDRSDIDRALEARPRIIHLSGVTPALSESCDDAVGYAFRAAAEQGIVSSFDVNFRPALWDNREQAAGRLRELSNASDIVFVGRDEAHALWGTSSVESIREFVPGARTLVVKDGDRQAVVFEGGRVISVPALRVDVLEPVGAGDAFAAGWLSSFLRGHDPATSLRFGHLMARAALTSLSDQGAAVSRDTLDLLARDDSQWGQLVAHQAGDGAHASSSTDRSRQDSP